VLRLAVVFFVIALVAAFLGWGGVTAVSLDAARILCIVFLVLAVLSFLGNFLRGGAQPRDLV